MDELVEFSPEFFIFQLNINRRMMIFIMERIKNIFGKIDFSNSHACISMKVRSNWSVRRGKRQMWLISTVLYILFIVTQTSLAGSGHHIRRPMKSASFDVVLLVYLFFSHAGKAAQNVSIHWPFLLLLLRFIQKIICQWTCCCFTGIRL